MAFSHGACRSYEIYALRICLVVAQQHIDCSDQAVPARAQDLVFVIYINNKFCTTMTTICYSEGPLVRGLIGPTVTPDRNITKKYTIIYSSMGYNYVIITSYSDQWAFGSMGLRTNWPSE